MKKLFVLAVLILTPLVNYGQFPDAPASLPEELRKLVSPPTYGGSFKADRLRPASHGVSQSSSLESAKITIGALRYEGGKEAFYAIPITIENTDNVSDVSVYLDKEMRGIARSEFWGDLVRKDNKFEGHLKVQTTGEHRLVVVLKDKNGHTLTESGVYTVPPCPEPEVVTVIPDASVNSVVMRGVVKGPEGLVKSAEVYYAGYFSKELLEKWDPNTVSPAGVFRTRNTKLNGGLVEAYENGFPASVQTYGYPALGWYAVVAETLCGTKIKSDLREFRTARRQEAPRASIGQIRIVQVPVGSASISAMQVEVDTQGDLGYIFVYFNAEALPIGKLCEWWPTNYWQILPVQYALSDKPETKTIPLHLYDGYRYDIQVQIHFPRSGKLISASFAVLGTMPTDCPKRKG